MAILRWHRMLWLNNFGGKTLILTLAHTHTLENGWSRTWHESQNAKFKVCYDIFPKLLLFACLAAYRDRMRHTNKLNRILTMLDCWQQTNFFGQVYFVCVWRLFVCSRLNVIIENTPNEFIFHFFVLWLWQNHSLIVLEFYCALWMPSWQAYIHLVCFLAIFTRKNTLSHTQKSAKTVSLLAENESP